MAYTAPTITSSGTTFAQLQAGGASGHLERLIAANTGLTTHQIRLIRRFERGAGQATYDYLADVVRSFNQGNGSAIADVQAAHYDAAVALAVLDTLAAEIGALIAANTGTLKQVATPIGGVKTVRTWP